MAVKDEHVLNLGEWLLREAYQSQVHSLMVKMIFPLMQKMALVGCAIYLLGFAKRDYDQLDSTGQPLEFRVHFDKLRNRLTGVSTNVVAEPESNA
jgi:hypothetical protein